MKKINLVIGCIALFLASSLLKAQNTNNKVDSANLTSRKVKGCLVYSLNQLPVSNAQVKILGTGSSTVTDENGNYEFETNLKFPFKIVINAVGFESKELLITNDSLITELQIFENVGDVVVTARQKNEQLQEVPIPAVVLSKSQLENASAFNINRIKEMIPTIQLYSSNPRNTGLNIRGLGSTFGLTNDGIDPGVGFYIDGVYYSRAAATSMDFVDVNQVEVLMGPQGTLFGKNTTAGALSLTSKRPTFKHGIIFENTVGNYGFIQSKLSLTGPLIRNKLAIRISMVATSRNGVLYNQNTEKSENTLESINTKWQFYYKWKKGSSVLITDISNQKPSGYALVFAGTVKTKRPNYRQFDSIIRDLNYNLPTQNPFDRVIDQNTKSLSNQALGGISLTNEMEMNKFKIKSISAIRFWKWDPSSDRDFMKLDALRKSMAPSMQRQYSQEIRILTNKSNIGLFVFHQTLQSDSFHIEELGSDQWRFSQNTTSSIWRTKGLLDGFGIKTFQDFKNTSIAIFGNHEQKIINNLILLVGIRCNYDFKYVEFNRITYGQMNTIDSNIIKIQNSIYTNQYFKVENSDYDYSGNLTLNYSIRSAGMLYSTYAVSYKPIGVNMGGLPNSNGKPLLDLAYIKPERLRYYEIGYKSNFSKKVNLNFSLYRNEINDYQTVVQSTDLSVNRGYIANAEKVRVQGAEMILSMKLRKALIINASICYTDGRYIVFKNSPVPIEEVGGKNLKNISGEILPGISKWSGNINGEYNFHNSKLLDLKGKYFMGFDYFYRTKFSSSPAQSKFLNINEYGLLNMRFGFNSNNGFTLFIWGRNIKQTNYFEQLLVAPGNIGYYGAVLGDPRMYGITLRYNIDN